MQILLKVEHLAFQLGAGGNMVNRMRAPKDSPEHIAWLRSLSLDERGEMICSACRTAAVILESRRAAGLPPPQRPPWPESTLALLKKYAEHAGPE